jgi:putative ABC transport system permease protein
MAAAGEIGMLRVAYNDRSRGSVADKSSELEELFERERIGVSSSTPVWLLRNAVAAHMRVLVNSLLAMAVLMAIVGTFGLMSTLSMNVLERTREIGVMRAIGATPKKVRNLIVFEALIIGILSILIAVIASLLLSYYMGSFIGHMSFRISLPLTVSSVAILLWVAIVISGSYLATLHPVNRANRISVRQALAYE